MTRMSHQQARNMRISQQRILRESSLEIVEKAAQPCQSNGQGQVNKNFASAGLSFSSANEQMMASAGPP